MIRLSPDARDRIDSLHRWFLTALLIGSVASISFPRYGNSVDAAHESSRGLGVDEAAFLAENDVAMKKMMADMAAKPTGDVDRDFVAMMAPHHQGAIDMAQALLRYGSNEQLRRLAQEIIVTQQQEIAVMRLAIGESVAPSSPASSTVSNGEPDAVPATKKKINR